VTLWYVSFFHSRLWWRRCWVSLGIFADDFWLPSSNSLTCVGNWCALALEMLSSLLSSFSAGHQAVLHGIIGFIRSWSSVFSFRMDLAAVVGTGGLRGDSLGPSQTAYWD